MFRTKAYGRPLNRGTQFGTGGAARRCAPIAAPGRSRFPGTARLRAPNRSRGSTGLITSSSQAASSDSNRRSGCRVEVRSFVMFAAKHQIIGQQRLQMHHLSAVALKFVERDQQTVFLRFAVQPR